MSTVAPKILLRGPVGPNGGYGRDLIFLSTALIKAGMDVRLHPTTASPPLPPAVAHLLTKKLDAPFDLFINHVDPGQLECTDIARYASGITLAWTMWEFSGLQMLKGKSTLKKRLQNFDMLLSYTELTEGAFAPYLPKRTKSAVLQGGYDPENWPFMERDWNSPRFSFIFHGEANQRKDVWTTIAAFQELKDEYPEEFEPAEFHIHTTLNTIPKIIETAIPKIRVHYETWSEDLVRQFYQSGHVLISSSKGEGKNLPCLEMLSTGGSVIAAPHSGHLNWMSDSYAYPVDFKMVPFHEAKYGNDCQWAAVSKEDLKAQMLHVFRNREEVKRKGEIGSEMIPQMCSWDKVVKDLFRRIADTLPGKGQELKYRFDEIQRELESRNGR